MRDWRMAAAAAALALGAVVPAAAQENSGPRLATAEEIQAARANPASFADAWIALQDGDQDYLACVDEKKKAALTDMWTRRAPLEAAIYDISVAYRQCDGFDAFWNAVFFAGFDAPEHWIALEIEAAKAALLKQNKVEAKQLDQAAELFDEAVRETLHLTIDDADARGRGRDKLLQHFYVATALRPNGAPAPDVQELLEENAELLSAILPEPSTEALKAAVDLLDRRDSAEDLAEMMTLSGD